MHVVSMLCVCNVHVGLFRRPIHGGFADTSYAHSNYEYVLSDLNMNKSLHEQLQINIMESKCNMQAGLQDFKYGFIALCTM